MTVVLIIFGIVVFFGGGTLVALALLAGARDLDHHEGRLLRTRPPADWPEREPEGRTA